MFELPPSPADGACGVVECDGEDCEDAPIVDPSFAFWLDESTVEDGTPFSDFDPAGKDRCIEGVRRPGSATVRPTTGFEKARAREQESGSRLPDASDVPSASDLPEAPEAPEGPSAPTAPSTPDLP